MEYSRLTICKSDVLEALIETDTEILNINLNFVSSESMTETISLPKTLHIIDDQVFFNSTRLKYIDLPDDVESIGDYAFYNCVNLEHVKLPNNVKMLGKYCFKHCEKLMSIDLPSTLISIGEQCFKRCNFEKIDIPEAV